MRSSRYSRFSLTVVLAAMVVWGFSGCSQTGSLEPESSTINLLERTVAGRVAGDQTVSVSKWINYYRGGTLVIDREDIGRTTLRIPPRSIDRSWVQITMEVSVNGVVDVELGPEGLTFSDPAILQLSYKGTGYQGDAGALRVFYDNELFWEEVSGSEAYGDVQAVRAGLQHFSRYAIGSVE